MKVKSVVQCKDFPSLDTRRDAYLVPDVDIDPGKVTILLISEAAPQVLWRFSPLKRTLES